MANESISLTQAELKRLLSYDPETGIFRWKVRNSKSVWIGDIAGSITNHGYNQIRVNSKVYLAHRLAWFYVHGVWPVNELDHINRDRSDDRIANLREATDSQNQWNRAKSRNNTSGFKGICWCKRRQKWRANISVNRKYISLGSFDDIRDAIKAHADAAQKYHGEYAGYD